LQLHLLPHDVDAGHQAGGALIFRQTHQRLGRRHLGAGRLDAGGVRFDLQVERADGEHDGLAHIAEIRLTGAHERTAGAQPANRAGVEDRRGEADAGVEDAERADERRQSGQLEAERRRAEHLIGLPHRR
jgi:hypothetical protein